MTKAVMMLGMLGMRGRVAPTCSLGRETVWNICSFPSSRLAASSKGCACPSFWGSFLLNRAPASSLHARDKEVWPDAACKGDRIQPHQHPARPNNNSGGAP